MEKRSDITAKTQGTCDWVLRHLEYLEWKQTGGLFLVSGRAGAGKSTIMESLLEAELPHGSPDDEASGSRPAIASFFFHRRGEALHRSALGLFRSLLHQVLSQDQDLLSDFCQDIEFERRCNQKGEEGGNWRWRESELKGLLTQYVKRFTKTRSLRLYIDALDESGEATARDLIGYLAELRIGLPVRLSICVSCRPWPKVITECDRRIVVEYENKEDIESYLKKHLNYEQANCDAQSQRDLEEIRAEIANRAMGVFQWVFLVTKRIGPLLGEDKDFVLREVSRLPSQLSDLYEEMLNQLPNEDLEMAIRVLRWITFSYIPLSIQELRFAIAADPHRLVESIKDLQTSVHWCKDEYTLLARIDRLSKGLVILVEHQSPDQTLRLQFDHESVQDYMFDRGISYLEARAGLSLEGSSVGRSNRFLMLGCLRYVQSLQEGHYERENLDIAHSLPLTSYALDFGLWHAAVADAEGSPLSDLIEITNCPSNNFWAKWYWLLDEEKGRDLATSYNISEKLKRTQIQHIAAAYGLRSVLMELYTAPASTKVSLWDKLSAYLRSSRSSPWYTPTPDTDPLDTKDSMGRTPLSLAATAGHNAIVEFLLKTGRVNANSQDIDGFSPVQRAAVNVHFGVTKMLLAIQAVDIGPWDNACSCPLITATHGGRNAFVRALRDIGCSDSFLIPEALKATIIDLAGHGYLESLQMLLAARTDSTLSHALFALELAGHLRHVQVVEGLLAIKVNNDAAQASRAGATLLDLLVERHRAGEPSMIAALSAASDADPSATAKAFVVWTCVSFPGTLSGYNSNVEHLLPDLTIQQISCKDFRYCRNLLHWASRKNEEALVKRCIHLGASVEAQDKHGKTPLHYAKPFSTVGLLAEAGADLRVLTAEQVNNQTFTDQKSFLHWAAETGSGDIAERCLHLGADVEARDVYRETPLHYATESGHFNIVKLLVEAGSDLDAIDIHGRKPLDCAMGKGPGGNSNRRFDAEIFTYLMMSTYPVNYLDKLTPEEYRQKLMAMR